MLDNGSDVDNVNQQSKIKKEKLTAISIRINNAF